MISSNYKDHGCRSGIDRWYKGSNYLHSLFIVLSTLSIFLASSISLKSQSLFEIAVELDMLYDSLTVVDNTTSADQFFKTIRLLYPPNSEIEEIDIKYDFRENAFLNNKINNAFDKLVISKGIDDNLSPDESNITGILDDVKLMVEQFCIDNRSSVFCVPGGNIRSIYEVTDLEGLNSYIFEIQQSNRSNEGSLEFDDLLRNLRSAADEIVHIKSIIDKNESESSRVIFESAKTGFGLPILGVDKPDIPSFVLQQAGSQSLSTSIIDGTAKWIADRMRQEVYMAFFDRFEQWVSRGNIKTLFPNTFAAMRSFVSTDFELMIQIFRSAYQKDLSSLPFNLPQFLEFELLDQATIDQNEQRILEASMNFNLLKDSLHLSEIKVKDVKEKMIRLYEQYENEYYTNITFSWDDFDKKIEPIDLQLINATNKQLALQDSLVYYQNALLNAKKRAFKSDLALKFVLFTIKALELLSEGEHPSNLLSYLHTNMLVRKSR